MDPNVKESIVARLKEATNVLVTVSNDPSVDQLAACIGFTLLVNKVGKRGAAVFSGAIPSTLEFLQPDQTIEKNTDSLRDFIIALDKSKADKLRYKVEDKVVKIFITPYRTSISDKDLDYSQGDFNVDVVLALGVHQKSELDEAIVSHGRILHDATVISVNNKDQGNLGTLNWVDLQASSLSEMMATIGQQLGGAEAFDEQIATALMTGIVAETDRFSNEKTSPTTMKLASELMGAGANQQLIATKLQEPGAALGSVIAPESTDDDGELNIVHDKEEAPEEAAKEPEIELPEPQATPIEITTDSSDSESESETEKEDEEAEPSEEKHDEPVEDAAVSDDSTPSRIGTVRGGGTANAGPSMTFEPPSMGGKLTANSEPEHLKLDPSTDPLSAGAQKSGDTATLNHDSAPAITPLPSTDEASSGAQSVSPQSSPSLADGKPADIASSEEAKVDDTEPKEEQLEEAREAVEDAIEEGGDPEKNLEPIQALGAQPVNLNLGHEPDVTQAESQSPQTPESTTSSPSDNLSPFASSDVPIPPVPSLPPSPAAALGDYSGPPSGAISMPPNPTTLPPAPSNELRPSTLGMPQPPLPGVDTLPPAPASPLPSLDQPVNMPANLMPPSAPMDHSGSSGPATPPPPVPPPMPPMPSMPGQQPQQSPFNPGQ